MQFFKRKLSIKSSIVTFALTALTLVLLPKTDAEASFHHVHTSACYGQQEVLCTNHRIFDEWHYHTYHCNTCQKMTTFKEIVWWDECLNGYRDNHDVAYLQTCTECGSTRRDEDPGDPRSHYVTQTVLKCGKTESSSVATVSLNVRNSAPTNGSVIIDAGVSASEAGFGLASAPYNFGNGYTSNSSYEVTANGTYTVSVKRNNGEVASASVTVNSIDKTNPVVSLSKSTEEWIEEGLTITVDASDEGFGLAENPYSYNGGDYTADNTFFVKENQTVTVTVRDKVGNETTESIEIKNIGRDPAVVAAEKAEAERKAKEEAEAKAKAEAEAKAKAEAERQAKIEAERRAEEEKRAADAREAERIAEENEKKAQEEAIAKAENEKKAAELAAKEKAEKEKAEKAKKEKAEKEKKEKAEKEALEKAEKEKAKLEKEAAKAKEKAENEAAKAALKAEKEAARKGLEEGKEISLTDLSNKENASLVDSMEGLEKDSADALSNLDENNKDTVGNLEFTTASAGKLTLIAGIVLIAVSALFASFFNYIYVSEGGKKRLISLCKVDITKDTVYVNVPEGKIDKAGKYLIYFSPFKKMKLKNLRVVVKIEGEEKEISTDAGNTFMY